MNLLLKYISMSVMEQWSLIRLLDDLHGEFVILDQPWTTLKLRSLTNFLCFHNSPHEENTLKNEDPVITVSAKYQPSEFVFPDDPMVFMIELTNMGVGAFSEFLLYSTQSTGMGGLTVSMDGVALTEGGTPVFMLKDTKIEKQVWVQRGPGVYRDAPPEITLQSMCE